MQRGLSCWDKSMALYGSWFTAQQLWASVSLDVCGIRPHLAHSKMQTCSAAHAHLHMHTCAHRHTYSVLYRMSLWSTPALRLQCCQLYLTWPARNNISGEWIWHTCQIWQAWVGCDWEVEMTAIAKVEGGGYRGLHGEESVRFKRWITESQMAADPGDETSDSKNKKNRFRFVK